MPGLPSRPDDHDQGSARSALFASDQRHVMIDRVQPPIALAMNSRPSSQRSGVVLRSSKLFAVNQGLHTLPFAGPEKIPNRSPPGSFPPSPMACSLYVPPIRQTKPIGHGSSSGLVQPIFSLPTRLRSRLLSAYAYCRRVAKLKMLCPIGTVRTRSHMDDNGVNHLLAHKTGSPCI